MEARETGGRQEVEYRVTLDGISSSEPMTKTAAVDLIELRIRHSRGVMEDNVLKVLQVMEPGSRVEYDAIGVEVEAVVAK